MVFHFIFAHRSKTNNVITFETRWRVARLQENKHKFIEVTNMANIAGISLHIELKFGAERE